MELTRFLKIFRYAQGKNEFDLEKTIKLMIIQRLDLPSGELRTYERQADHGFEKIAAKFRSISKKLKINDLSAQQHMPLTPDSI